MTGDPRFLKVPQVVVNGGGLRLLVRPIASVAASRACSSLTASRISAFLATSLERIEVDPMSLVPLRCCRRTCTVNRLDCSYCALFTID